MKMKIEQYVPRFISGYSPFINYFSSLDELLSLRWVARNKEINDFYQFTLCPTRYSFRERNELMLMAEFEEGYRRKFIGFMPNNEIVKSLPVSKLLMRPWNPIYLHMDIPKSNVPGSLRVVDKHMRIDFLNNPKLGFSVAYDNHGVPTFPNRTRISDYLKQQGAIIGDVFKFQFTITCSRFNIDIVCLEKKTNLSGIEVTYVPPKN